MLVRDAMLFLVTAMAVTVLAVILAMALVIMTVMAMILVVVVIAVMVMMMVPVIKGPIQRYKGSHRTDYIVTTVCLDRCTGQAHHEQPGG